MMHRWVSALSCFEDMYVHSRPLHEHGAPYLPVLMYGLHTMRA